MALYVPPFKIAAVIARLCSEYGCETFPLPLSCTDGRTATVTVIVRLVNGESRKAELHDRGKPIRGSALEPILTRLGIPLADFGLEPGGPPRKPRVELN